MSKWLILKNYYPWERPPPKKLINQTPKCCRVQFPPFNHFYATYHLIQRAVTVTFERLLDGRAELGKKVESPLWSLGDATPIQINRRPIGLLQGG